MSKHHNQWRSEATTSGGVFTCKFHILPTNSILLVNLPTIFNKFTDRTRSFNRFFCFTLVLPTNLPKLGGVAAPKPPPPASYAPDHNNLLFNNANNTLAVAIKICTKQDLCPSWNCFIHVNIFQPCMVRISIFNIISRVYFDL